MAINEFLDLMSDTVDHAELLSRDRYDTPSYGTPTTYAARVVKEQTKVKDSQGQEVLATTTVWIGGTPDVNTDDQLTLPDGTTPQILAISRPTDEDGAHHTKVFCG